MSFDFSQLPEVSRVVDAEIYPRKHLTAARTAFQRFCQITFESVGSQKVKVTLSPNDKSEPEFRQTVLEFWNYALDAHCQARLE